MSGSAHMPLLFMFVALLLGTITQYFISRYAQWLPYTCAVLVIGVVLGALHGRVNLGELSGSIEMWEDIDAHLLLYAFLPALLFGDAMTLNTHVFHKAFSQCLLLAGPGVIIGTVLTALAAGPIASLSGCNWEQDNTDTTGHNEMWMAWTFGAISSATDPVAVVALLKDLGANPILTMQITGESLLNDGVAVVLFLVFFESLVDPEKQLGVGSALRKVLQMGLGGPLFGLLVGGVALKMLRLASKRAIKTDGQLQIIITLAFAYFAFFVGEHVLHVSGVLSTVFAALVLARDARPHFVSFEALEHFWHSVEWLANTLIFMVSGLLFGRFTSCTQKQADAWECVPITASDWGVVFLFYLLANAVRAAMVAILYPLLRKVGYKAKWEDAAFMVWGGLRGAVGQALALIVFQTQKTYVQNDGHWPSDDLIQKKAQDARRTQLLKDVQLLLVVTGALAFLTLLINGILSAKVLDKLGLVTPAKSKNVLFEITRTQIMESTQKRFRDMKESSHFYPREQGTLKRLVDQQMPYVVSSLRSKKASEQRNRSDAARQEVVRLFDDEEMQIHLREIFLKIVKSEYLESLERRELTKSAQGEAYLLTHSVEVALDPPKLRKRLSDWENLERHWPLRKYPLTWETCGDMLHEILTRLCGRDKESKLHHKLVEERHQAAFYVLRAFIDAHKHAQEKLMYYSGKTGNEAVLKESQEDVEKARRHMKVIYARGSEQHILANSITSQLSDILLEKEREEIEHLEEHGILTSREAHSLLHHVVRDKYFSRRTRIKPKESNAVLFKGRRESHSVGPLPIARDAVHAELDQLELAMAEAETTAAKAKGMA